MSLGSDFISTQFTLVLKWLTSFINVVHSVKIQGTNVLFQLNCFLHLYIYRLCCTMRRWKSERKSLCNYTLHHTNNFLAALWSWGFYIHTKNPKDYGLRQVVATQPTVHYCSDTFQKDSDFHSDGLQRTSGIPLNLPDFPGWNQTDCWEFSSHTLLVTPVLSSSIMSHADVSN